MPHGITECYLPPGGGDIPALTPAEAGTQLSDPGVSTQQHPMHGVSRPTAHNTGGRQVQPVLFQKNFISSIFIQSQ